MSGGVANAQQKNEFCDPSVIGLPRPKGLILKYEIQPKFSITSQGKNGYGDAEAHVKKASLLDFKIRFPIVNKAHLKMAGGLNYSSEEYQFTSVSTPGYPVYRALEDKDLRSAGVHFYLVKPTRSDRYFLLRVSADLNGDFTNKKIPLGDFLKFSVSPLLGWKRNDNLSYAIGIAYGYTFGRPSIYPLFSYNRNFSKTLGLESVLPVNIKLRYSRSEHTYWYAGAELKGASYRLSNELPGLSGIDKPHLHRSELRFLVSLEKQIHGWLWTGLEGGMRQNIIFNITNSPRARSEVLISNKLGMVPFFNISLFLVPPRSIQ